MNLLYSSSAVSCRHKVVEYVNEKKYYKLYEYKIRNCFKVSILFNDITVQIN